MSCEADSDVKPRCGFELWGGQRRVAERGCELRGGQRREAKARLELRGGQRRV